MALNGSCYDKPILTLNNQVIVFFESLGIIAKSFVQIFSYFPGKLPRGRPKMRANGIKQI